MAKHGTTPTGDYPKDAGSYGNEPRYRPVTAKSKGKRVSEHRQGLKPSDYERLPAKY